MRIKVIVEPSAEGGYLAIVPVLPGCVAEGRTPHDAVHNVRAVIEECLTPAGADAEPSPGGEVVDVVI